MAFDFYNVVTGVGALNNATRPLWPAPSGAHGGGLTVTEASVVQSATGSAEFALLKGTLNSGGTFVANGTLAPVIGGTGDTWLANVPKSFTLAAGSAALSAGEWLALKEDNVGAAATVTTVVVSALQGK